MNLSLLNKLKELFGFEDFRPGQDEIISAILRGKHVLAVLPTGGGKSICYQLPAIVGESFSIVISPLIALMKDQVDNINKSGKVAAFINSSMEPDETEKVLREISFGIIKLLYLAPEKLESIRFAEQVKNLNPNHLFVDEAHCISEWGHNFRPSYTKIKDFADYCGIKKIAAFTATATPEVVQDIINQLGLKNPLIFVRGFERENLHLNVLFSKNKKKKLLELLSATQGSAIIYTASRKNAEEVSEFLTTSGYSCTYYHAGLPNPERRRIQEQFINGELQCIAATNAFGMGIDKSDIRLVIHFNAPGSIENYYQEIGRAGRDGTDSSAYLLFEEKDLRIHQFFISNAHPEKNTILKVYKAICDFNQVAVGSNSMKELIIEPEYISRYANMNISKGLLHASLKYLQSSGYLKVVSGFDKKEKIRFLLNQNQLKQFLKQTSNDEFKNILLIMLREFGNILFSEELKISLSKLSSTAGVDESELKNLLQSLDYSGIISYQPAIMKDTILLTQPRADDKSIKLNYKKINESYINAQKKLDKISEFVYSKDCRFKFILNYFGENLEDYSCGNCDNCKIGKSISDSTMEYVSEIIIETVEEAGQQIPENAVVNILRGKAAKESFRKFKYFGACKNFDANEIRIAVHKLVTQQKIRRSPGRITFLQPVEDEKILSRHIEKSISYNAEFEQDLLLFNSLKELRKKASEKFLQSGYVICPDPVLRDIVKLKPKTKSELLSVNGFTERMFNKIGMEILENVNQLSGKNYSQKVNGNIPKNLMQTQSMILKKYSLKEMANLLRLSEAVVSMQLETIVEYDPGIDIAYLIDKKILAEVKQAVSDGKSNLKEIKENMKTRTDYPIIRIALAKIKFNSGS